MKPPAPVTQMVWPEPDEAAAAGMVASVEIMCKQRRIRNRNEVRLGKRKWPARGLVRRREKERRKTSESEEDGLT